MGRLPQKTYRECPLYRMGRYTYTHSSICNGSWRKLNKHLLAKINFIGSIDIVNLQSNRVLTHLSFDVHFKIDSVS